MYFELIILVLSVRCRHYILDNKTMNVMSKKIDDRMIVGDFE